jgi:hypothetical protein
LIHKKKIQTSNESNSEAHPDAIGSDGFATPEDYQKDLAYLKQKVLIFLYLRKQMHFSSL